MKDLDRRGIPLQDAITPATMPTIPTVILNKIRKAVRDAVTQYYRYNIRRGCTNTDAPNFSFIANVDDGSCYLPVPTGMFPFGGVYQVCDDIGDFSICSNLSVKNSMTNEFSCGPSYQPYMLDTKNTEVSRTVSICKSCWVVFKCCEPKTEVAHAVVSAFWCGADPLAKPIYGYQFSGIYSANVPNDLTLGMNCPNGALKATLLNDLTVCYFDLQTNTIKDKAPAVPFAGFTSCRSGNPYASAGGVQCPAGYSLQLAQINDGCDISYCIQASKTNRTKLMAVRVPPFMAKPQPMQAAAQEMKVPSLIEHPVSVEVAMAIFGNLQWGKQETMETTAKDDLQPGRNMPVYQDEVDEICTVEESDDSTDDNGMSPTLVLMCWASTGMILFTIGWALCKVRNTWSTRKGYEKV